MKTIFLVFALLPSPAFSQTVEVLQNDPAAGSTLHANEPLYMHLKYQSDQPLRFQMMGFLKGGKMDKSASFNPAPAYPAGEGEAIVWIAYHDKTGIDQVKVIVSDTNWETIEKISLPLEISWSGRPSKMWRQPAEWVRILNAQQQEMASQFQAQGEPPSAGETAFWSLLMMLMAWSVPGYIALQTYMLVKYEGRWRKLAMLPLIGTVPLFAYTLFALLAGSNLWPLMLLFLAPAAFIYLLVILWLKKRASTNQNSS